MIVIDENVDQAITDQLASAGYELYSVRENSPGITDRKIIKFASVQKAMLITEDKDFGELVFSHQIKGCSVILLRYGKSDLNRITKHLMPVLEKQYQSKDNHFITITPKKVRVRKI